MKKDKLIPFFKIIGTFQLISLSAIVMTFLFNVNYIQSNCMYFITISVIIQLSILIISALVCIIVYFMMQLSNNKYEEFRKNIPEYIYKSEIYSTEPISDKSEKIIISDITDNCYINGYGNYDPNNP